MNIRIEPYASRHVPAVQGFNSRLRSKGETAFRLGECPQEHSPRREYVAVDREGEVRGSFSLKQQQFRVNGRTLEVGNCQFPLSEGIVDAAYVSLGMVLLRHALTVQPLLFCLGMGGRDKRLPRMLRAMRWTIVDIPFRFRVCNARRVLRNVVPLRNTAYKRRLMDVLAASGAGSIGIRALQKRVPAPSSVAIETFEHFGAWADALWDACADDYSLSAARTSEMLNASYGGPTFIRLQITRGCDIVGWVVLRDTQMRQHRYFGDLRVATIVDAMAAPSEANAVLQAATKFVCDRGVDLIVSNQGHRLWLRALRHSGFLPGPTNYILAMSPRLAGHLDPIEAHRQRLHITRGDGDGPLDL